MSEPLKPRRLTPGARIGVVSPASWLEPDQQERAKKVFEDLGYEIVMGKSTGLRLNAYAGSAEERADDIHRMFSDSSIDAIVCARGGYGSNRVLPLLDYELIRNHPKIFVGYSDITGILISTGQKSGLITFHGPMLHTFGKKTEQYNLDSFHRVLSGEDNIRLTSSESCQARTLKPGTAKGPLWGGNLVLLAERLGTSDQLDTDGIILFIEEIDEALYAFDRLLLQLRKSGSLDKINGLIIGETIDMGVGRVPFGKSVDEIVLDICGDLSVPVISNFPCGHGDCQATFPVAHTVELHAEPDQPFILLPESPVL